MLMRHYPIETTRGRYGGGVKIADGFYLYRNHNPKNLTPKEKAVLEKLSTDADLDDDDRDILDGILAKFAP